jgi:manganese transport protein
VLNIRLVAMGISEWLAVAGAWRPLAWLVVAVAGAGLAVLLLWITLEPAIARLRRFKAEPVAPVPDTGIAPAAPAYARIMVTLDHTGLDREALAHAAAMARANRSKLYLVHVEEGVTSQVYGPLASTAEVEAGAVYLERIARSLRAAGLEVDTAVFHSSDPRKEIVRYARQVRPDLLIMGAHGHGGLKDLVFGTTINPVRHDLDVPVLVVRGPDSKA